MRLIALFLFMLSVTGFPGCGIPKPPPNVPDDGSTCADVCEHGHVLGCSWAEPTPRGATCLEVCHNATEGGPISWDLGCMSRAPSCAAVDVCNP